MSTNETTRVEGETRIYYSFTPEERIGLSKKQRVKRGIPGPSCIALKIEGNVVSYGVAFCVPEDNFVKAEGRKHALKMLNEGILSFNIKREVFMSQDESGNERPATDHELSLAFLSAITENVAFDREGFKSRIRRRYSAKNNKSIFSGFITSAE